MESTTLNQALQKELVPYIGKAKQNIPKSHQKEFIDEISEINIENIKKVRQSISETDRDIFLDKIAEIGIKNNSNDISIHTKNSEINEIQRIFEIRNSFIQKTEQQIPDIKKRTFNYQILNSYIGLIDNIGKKINHYIKLYNRYEIIDELRELNKLKQLRKIVEKQSRILELEYPFSESQFKASLMWMVEKGQKEDLKLIEKIKSNPPYTSEEISNLLEKAEDKIVSNMISIQYKYRVFCTNKESIKNFNQTINIIDSYDEFIIILTTEEVCSQLRDLYPIELLESDPIYKKDKDSVTVDKEMKYLVVKFYAPIPRDWKEIIEKTGAKVIQAAGRSEGIILVDNENIVNHIINLEEVKEVNKHEPKIPEQFQYLQKKSEKSLTDEETKEAVAAARLQAAKNPQEYHQQVIPIPGILIANFFTEKDRENAAHNLEQEGIHIANRPGKTKLTLDVTNYDNPLDSIEIIRHQIGLRSLQEKTIPTLFNNVACNIIAKKVIPLNPMPNSKSLGLTGEGEIVAVADTGLDTGNIETLHLDFQGRVEMIQPFPITAVTKKHIENFEDDDASDKYSGHGTHVAGSILGTGEQATIFGESSVPKGMAPKAKLIFQAIEKTPKWTLDAIKLYLKITGKMPPVSGLFGIPDDLKQLFQKAYSHKARIHSNSWGEEVSGLYDQKCQDLDEFVWNNKDFLVIVAAGNYGKHSFSGIPGIDPKSVASPAIAKNCLTVGASENDHNGKFHDTYGLRNPNNFPYPPFKDDNIADCIDDIAAFSGRGPCEDGRCKPDLVAPGTLILSTRSSQIASNNFAEGYYSPAKDHYMYMSGTSMATPLVAGSAALVRQYLKEKRNIANSTAALVKATLIHSAQYMNYRYAHPSSAPWADNEQGWGRVNLSTVLNPESPTKVIFIDQSEGLVTGDGHEYKVAITNDNVPLRATLVYTDFPNEVGSIEPLFNNLNLILLPPSDKHRRYYLGNDFKNTGEIDNCNNVEGCIIEPEQVVTGVWTIKVVGSDIPEAPQDYALVISGGNLEQV